MDRSIAQSRLEELRQRMHKLRALVRRRVDQGRQDVEVLLLETVDVTNNLVDLTSELLQGQIELAQCLESHNYSESDGFDTDDVSMVCPHCYARMSLYSPS